MCVVYYIQYWKHGYYSDESTIYTSVRNLLSEGIPRIGFSSHSPFFDQQYPGKIYLEYIPEIIARVPMQFLAHMFDMPELQQLSPFIWFLVLLIYLARKYKTGQFELNSLIWSFSLIYIATTPFLLSGVFRIRYFFFSILVLLVCMNWISGLISKNDITLKEFFKIALISVIPILFHELNIIFTGAVLLVAVTSFSQKIFTKLKVTNVKQLLVYLVVALCILLPVIYSMRNLLDLLPSLELNLGTLGQFLSYTIFSNYYVLFANILLIVALCFCYKHIPIYLRRVFSISLVILIVGMLLSAFLPLDAWNSQRYSILFHVAFMQIVAIASILVYTYVKEKTNGVIGLISTLFVFSVMLLINAPSKNVNSQYDLPLDIEQNDYAEIITALSEKGIPEKKIIIFTDHPAYYELKFESTEVFMFRSYPDPQAYDVVYERIYRFCRDGWIRDIYGDRYIGSIDDYLRVLKECPDPNNTYIVFSQIQYGKADEDLINLLSSTGLLHENTPRSVAEHLLLVENAAMTLLLADD
jgi:hypothetical protein